MKSDAAETTDGELLAAALFNKRIALAIAAVIYVLAISPVIFDAAYALFKNVQQ